MAKDKTSRVEAAEAKRRAEQREEERRAARLARLEAHRERQAALQRRLAHEVLYAGRGVSQLLDKTQSNESALNERGLPLLHDAADLAELLGIDMRRLRWLTFHREVSRVTHYRQFQIPKSKGGHRTLSAPRPAMRAAQAAVREHILSKLSATEHAHAFVRGRSTLSNARPHVGKAILVKLDVTDFFGSITFRRVRGFFCALGYSGMVASLLALLTTEAKRVAAEVDGATYYVATGPRSLPQGALTSPELTNHITRTLDRRLQGYALAKGWAYTRYADDLSFSHSDGDRAKVGPLLHMVRRVLKAEGFEVNEDKVFISRAGRQQRVTGIVVNDQPGIDRKTLRRFRASVHRVGREGFRDGGERARMLGYAAYVSMVKPELGARYLAALRGAGGSGGSA